VFKTGNHKLIPIISSIVGLLCSCDWTIYGFYIDDWNVIIPNILGIVFSIVNISTWLYFYQKNKVNPQTDTLVEHSDPEKYDTNAPEKAEKF
jgi:hypothetical protein